jgi:Flp pilus assembly protein TadD
LLAGGLALAVASMKAGGKGTVTLCGAEGPEEWVEGTTVVELELLSWTEVEDLSAASDGAPPVCAWQAGNPMEGEWHAQLLLSLYRLMRFTGSLLLVKIQSGEESDYKMPKELSEVSLRYQVAAADGAMLAETAADAEPVVYVLDLALAEEGDSVGSIEGIDEALKKMKKGSKCELRRMSGGSLASTTTLELVAFEGPKESWDLKDDEKIIHAKKLKDLGNAAFARAVAKPSPSSPTRSTTKHVLKALGKDFSKAAELSTGELARAMRRYTSAKDALLSDTSMSEEQKTESKELKISLFNNMALVASKGVDSAAQKTVVAQHCEEVLKLDPSNTKALLRKGVTLSASGDLDGAATELRKAHALEPENKAVRKELVKLKKLLKAREEADKQLYGKMMKTERKDEKAGLTSDELAEAKKEDEATRLEAVRQYRDHQNVLYICSVAGGFLSSIFPCV